MKELEQYRGAMYNNICQPYDQYIGDFPWPRDSYHHDDTGAESPKTDVKMTYLKNKNIDEAIHQKLRKKNVYETVTQKICNFIVSQTNEKLHDKVASNATFQAVKAGQDPNGYLSILKNICFSNKLKQHPVWSLCLETRGSYNTVQYAN